MKLVLKGKCTIFESEGGFAPAGIEIDGCALSQEILRWLGVKDESDRGYCVGETGLMDLGEITITIEK